LSRGQETPPGSIFENNTQLSLSKNTYSEMTNYSICRSLSYIEMREDCFRAGLGLGLLTKGYF
jgi:hypothetical protein